MKVRDVLDAFSFTKSHINKLCIESKYGKKEFHRDSVSFIEKDILNSEVNCIYTISKPSGYYTEEYLVIYILL